VQRLHRCRSALVSSFQSAGREMITVKVPAQGARLMGALGQCSSSAGLNRFATYALRKFTKIYRLEAVPTAALCCQKHHQQHRPTEAGQSCWICCSGRRMPAIQPRTRLLVRYARIEVCQTTQTCRWHWIQHRIRSHTNP